MYSRLDHSSFQIRLLRLLPGHESDDIVCELFTVSLKDSNAYEALSYVWGTRMCSSNIILGETPKSVTENLESALRHLRYDTKRRILWIDALCINQDDHEERRRQVQFMDKIYSGAFKVVVWLGPHDARDKDAIKMVRDLGSDPKLHWTTFPMDHGMSLLKLMMFLRNDWWKRIWTVQEAVLARRLTYQIGKTRLSGKTLINLARSYDKHVQKSGCCSILNMSWHNPKRELNNVMDNILQIRQLQLMSQKSKFDEVASLFRDREATNPLDMVYGLLGISRGIAESSINYELSKTRAYELATRDCISDSKELNILSHVVHHNKEIRGFSLDWEVDLRENEPSWVPDWTGGSGRAKHDIEMAKYRAHFLQHYDACGAMEFQSSQNDPVGKLRVNGVSCDVIETVSNSISEQAMFSGNKYLMEDWRRILGIDKNPSRDYVGGDTIAEAFWRTLCLDVMMSSRVGDGAPPVRRAGADDRALYLAYWYTRFLNSDYLEFQDVDMGYIERFSTFREHIEKTIARRKFFVSKTGYMGLGPLGTGPGDHICVLAGGKAPFIVRTAQEDEREANDRFVCRLIGDAYVHGLMDGEVMELVQKGAAKIEGFELI